MEIRKISFEELEVWEFEIQGLIEETMKNNFPSLIIENIYYTELLERLRHYLQSGDAIVFGVIYEKELVGWIWCHEIYRFNERRLHIANLAVSPSKRGMGIASKLIATVEEYAKENKFSGIDLLVTNSNTSAVNFYYRNNFEIERLMMKKDIEK